jgi:signal transduction histidine kinase
MGSGTVGGLLIDYRESGTEAGVLTVRILNGERPSSIPPQTTKSAHFIFDWRQFEKWGIDESRIPAGSEVLFRSPSFWEQYKWGIIGAVVLLILETLLIAALLAQRSNLIRANKDRRTAELETQQHRMEIAHVTRAASMNELASSLAHQLSQPLTAIMSNAEVAVRLLDRNPPDLMQVREILKDVVEDDERAKEIISSMRTLLKKSSVQSKLVDLNQIVRTVVRLTDAEALLRKVSVTVTLQKNLAPILGYPIHLQQVVLNLLMNAMDAVHEKAEGERLVEIRTTIKDGNSQLVISDSGNGINTSELTHVFRPFYSTKPEGLGMGLPICRTIVESINGQIWAESIPGQGTTFLCSFPSAQSPPPI